MMTFKQFPNDAHITSLRQNRIHPNTKKETFHQGIDFSGISGSDDIQSIGNGRVRISEFQSGYGNVVVITHPATKSNGNQQFESLYAHLASREVKVGDNVTTGQIVGRKGSTGKYGNTKHLHFELFSPKFSSNYSTGLDPLLYMRDDNVVDLQVKLKRAGEDSVEIDGYFGKNTQGAIKRFQKKHGLEVDGFAGLGTMKVLNLASVIETPVNPTPIPSDQVASTHPIPPKKEETNINLTYSSPTLKKETEFSLSSRSHRQLIIKSAISAGANKDAWEGKLNDETLSGMDLLGLAVKYVIDSNK